MTRESVQATLQGKPRKISDTTTIWEHAKGGAAPMTPLERRMWSVICDLTGTNS